MFSKLDIAKGLTDTRTAVLVFNNRGHDKVSRVAYTNEKKVGKTELGGGASEIFTDCIDDIQGAINFARRYGAREIYLVGHSTGCQKSVYWASRKRGRGVKGIILLAPISDWAAETHLHGTKKVLQATKVAERMVHNKRAREFLPSELWHELLDAQRFLSLYDPNSVEEIFSYAQPRKHPRVFKSVHVPVLAIFAENDEFADRPVHALASWFQTNTQSKRFKTAIIPGVYHGFKGAEKRVTREIKKFINP